MKSFNVNTMRRELKNDMNRKSKNELIRIILDLSEKYLRLASAAKNLKESVEQTQRTYNEDISNTSSDATELDSSSQDSSNAEEHSSS